MYKHFFFLFLDIVLSCIAFIRGGWFILLVAVFLHFANKGYGAFFYQERPGKDEKIFKIIKFKTMTDERDKDGNLLPDKDRVTKVGALVRKLSVDELPQLINVLKGDMSFVGPRPLFPEYLPWYTEHEKIRHTVRPGITGWAQVNGRNNLSWDEKLAYDVYYVEHLTFGMDAKVFFTSFLNIFNHKDVNVIPGLRLGRLDDVRRKEKEQQCISED